jgi:hypothetical protein
MGSSKGLMVNILLKNIIIGTIFAYGQTTSGKTHTMLGTP